MATLDSNEINEAILALEKRRADLHSSITDTSKYEAQAHDLASLLTAALQNCDVPTIDALIISHGSLPSLMTAKTLLMRKLQLLNTIRLNNIDREVSTKLEDIYEFDYQRLSEIKSAVSRVDDENLKQKLLAKLLKKIDLLKDPLLSQFIDMMGKSQWLKIGSITPIEESKFIDLVNLQSLTDSKYPDSLWAFEIIAKNFKIAFDYHFNSEKSVNSIDKPDQFFNYLINYLNQHLLKIARLWKLNKTELKERFAHSEYITAAMKPITAKLLQYSTTLTQEGTENDKDVLELLTHLINETIQFDTHMIEQFYYDPLNDASWPGLFNNFTYEHLERLLVRDIKLYTSQFESIMNQDEVFHIDYTSVSSQDLKPTISSLKLKILLENLTFKNFSKFFKINYDSNTAAIKFKLKIFSKIYLNLLQSYLTRLDDGYDAFLDVLKSAKSVINDTPTSEIKIAGTDGLDRIFRLYCSSKYISINLDQWNQEFSFIELNELFNTRSGGSSVSLFDSIASEYHNLEVKIWQLLESFLSSSVTQIFRNYENLNTWNALQDVDVLKPSSQLQPLIQNLNTAINFISKIIPMYEVNKVKYFLISKIVEFYIDKIIKSNHFNSFGVNQLATDFQFLLKELKLNNFTEFPGLIKFEEFLKIMQLTHGQTHLHCVENQGITINQFAKIGRFDEFREEFGITVLNDSEILDVLLRIHIK